MSDQQQQQGPSGRAPFSQFSSKTLAIRPRPAIEAAPLTNEQAQAPPPPAENQLVPVGANDWQAINANLGRAESRVKNLEEDNHELNQDYAAMYSSFEEYRVAQYDLKRDLKDLRSEHDFLEKRFNAANRRAGVILAGEFVSAAVPVPTPTQQQEQQQQQGPLASRINYVDQKAAANGKKIKALEADGKMKDEKIEKLEEEAKGLREQVGGLTTALYQVLELLHQNGATDAKTIADQLAQHGVGVPVQTAAEAMDEEFLPDA